MRMDRRKIGGIEKNERRKKRRIGRNVKGLKNREEDKGEKREKEERAGGLERTKVTKRITGKKTRKMTKDYNAGRKIKRIGKRNGRL